MAIPSTLTRVLIADDHALARAGFRLLIEKIPHVEVVGEAGDGEELVQLAETLRPDVVFTDIEMPRQGGIEAVREIAKRAPHVRCVIVSMHDSPETVKLAAESGAAGYVMKDAPAQEFGHALAGIAQRGSYFSPAVAALLLRKSEPGPHDLLTERQVEIVKLIAQGESTKEIAYALNLSSKTVDAHRARIMERLHLNDIASITRYAVKHRLVAV